MPRHAPRAQEPRRTTRRLDAPKLETHRALAAKQPAGLAHQEQWMQMTTREYFSPYNCRQ